MNILVIGYGSIGSRHAAILASLGSAVSVVTAQTISNYPHYHSIEMAFENNIFDKIVIANPTHFHHATLKKVLALDFQGTILVEKPLFSKMELLEHEMCNHIYVAYNLRFHSLFQVLKALLQEDELVSFSVQVGSYLPDWRKNIDYRQCYSAKKECGGGVLRDLSHELDYILWLCGKCIEVTAIGGHVSKLEINSDDCYSILMRCERCPIITVQLDYLNRTPNRKIIIQTKKQNTIRLDLMTGHLTLNGAIHYQATESIQQTYFIEHKLMLQNKLNDFCTYDQGRSVMQLITTIEQAALEKKWITI